MRAFFLTISSLLFCLPQLSYAEQWQLIKSEQGINSFKKQQSYSKLLAFKAEAVVKHPISKVVNILLDSDHAESWIPKLIDSRVIPPSNWPLDYTQYTKFDAPWPIRDRLFLSRVQVDIGADGDTQIHYLNTQPDYREQGFVRGSAAGSTYTLKRNKINPQHTDVIAISVADPNGAIPKWLVNWVGMNMPHNTMLQLREKSAQNDIPMRVEIASLYSGTELALD